MMGLIIVTLALAVGWYVYDLLMDELKRARWREAQRDLEERRY
jgi:hypothetical protein